MRSIKRIVGGALAAAVVLSIGGLVFTASAAQAAGSDGPTPYTVTATGVQLPEGDTFRAHGHINWRTTLGSGGMHFDPNNGHPGGAFIGQSFFPITLEPGECITWVQISHYNEHFGEGGQAPVCAPKTEEPPVDPPAEPPFDGVEKYVPAYSANCEGWEYSHPAFRLPTGIEPTSYTVRIGAGTEPVAYTPGEKLSGTFENPYQVNRVEITLWAHYADGKPFAKQQLGQTKLFAAACEKPVPQQPPALTGSEERALDPVCQVPANGKADIVTEVRNWEQPYVWDASTWAWQLGEKSFSDWEAAATIVVEIEECDPPAEIPPVTKVPTSGPEPTLKLEATGSPWLGWVPALGALLALVGASLIVLTSRIEKRSA